MVEEDPEDKPNFENYVVKCLIVGIIAFYGLFLFLLSFFLFCIAVLFPFLIIWILNGLLVLNLEYNSYNWFCCAAVLYTSSWLLKKINKST